ncbi:guanylate kinase [bacterium]
MNPGKVIVISSPSGGGKTTIIQKLREMNPDLMYAISATTRVPRGQEKEGNDYFYLNKKDFKKRIQDNEFLEWAEVHGNYYGTLRSQVSDCLLQGKNIILDIDVQGGLAVQKQLKETILIFLMPPSINVLENRLRSRGTDDGETIENRLKAASQEMQAAEQYDYIIYNHDIEQAVHDIQQIIQS